MRKYLRRIIAIIFASILLITELPVQTYACTYDPGSDTLYCSREQGCYEDELLTAKKVVVDSFITRTGLDKLKKNENLESLYIRDMSNLTEEDLNIFYPYLVKGNVALAAVLFSYGDYYSSFGNDGTTLYRRVMKEKCPQVVTLRSCASVVSAALNAAGVIRYASAAVAGLVDYFNGSDEWVNLGPATEEDLQPGDVIFIDRRSHAAEYQVGAMEDVEYTVEEEYVYEYKGGYDEMGHKNYENEDPTGSSYEVFSPDQDGDGDIGEWEAEYWKCYWERVNPDGYVPPYDYYYVWEEDAKAKEAAEKQKKREEEEERQRAEQAERVKVQKKRAATKRVIHDHIFVWTGNEIITRYFSDSSGNIVSGSYTENYSNARSAAISKYNFTGDYYVYRYVGPLSTSVSREEMVTWEANTPAIIESLRANSQDRVANALSSIDNEEFERAAAEARARQLEEERKALRKKRMTQKLDLIRKQSICSYIMNSIGELDDRRNFAVGRLTGSGMSEENKKLYSGNITDD